MLFDQCRTGRKNGGKRQKQSADDRTKVFGNQTGCNSNGAAQQKPREIVVPLGLLERGKVDSYSHGATLGVSTRVQTRKSPIQRASQQPSDLTESALWP